MSNADASATAATIPPLHVFYTLADGSTGSVTATGASAIAGTAAPTIAGTAAPTAPTGSTDGDHDNNEVIIAVAVCIPVAILLVVCVTVYWKIGEKKKAAQTLTPPKSVDDWTVHYTARDSDDTFAVKRGKSSLVDDDFFDSNKNAARPVSHTTVV